MAAITKWYVVHTYSGYENKVQDNIKTVVDNRNMNDEILDVRVPTELVVEVKENGETKEVERKIFPGYVLVKVAVQAGDNEYTMSDEAWYVIRNTRGVTGFVGPESKPVPLTEKEVETMGLEAEEAEVATSVEVNYKVGDFVRITGGNLADYSGVVQEIDTEAGRVKVTISMFGRETSADLALNQVELA
ncbi:MAG: transcription termination/antitermination factor NusG [Clostridia bacterium]|nr:transcription termination/antitermination factor NusG [Clostridia bacterium]MBR5753791.1 transcription termination/antitermination factor NusG [Clostridia bacterium]